LSGYRLLQGLKDRKYTVVPSAATVIRCQIDELFAILDPGRKNTGCNPRSKLVQDRQVQFFHVPVECYRSQEAIGAQRQLHHERFFRDVDFKYIGTGRIRDTQTPIFEAGCPHKHGLPHPIRGRRLRIGNPNPLHSPLIKAARIDGEAIGESGNRYLVAPSLMGELRSIQEEIRVIDSIYGIAMLERQDMRQTRLFLRDGNGKGRKDT